ncbi:MAG: hypothetical protein HeimC3_49220 [Candidatus Heimdallarchaeota archaeon LC_3]|nr:MAG: hypothetical protein HeimC3_49220 [Candidatus Heimdallarchaeota archaeon LC_3]
MEFDDVRDKLTITLKQKGWKNVDYSKRFASSSGTIDLVASTGGFRKKVLMIAIGANPFDAGIAGLLLSAITEKGEKIIFLQEGNPNEVQITSDISVIANIEDLPGS